MGSEQDKVICSPIIGHEKTTVLRGKYPGNKDLEPVTEYSFVREGMVKTIVSDGKVIHCELYNRQNGFCENSNLPCRPKWANPPDFRDPVRIKIERMRMRRERKINPH